jgi:probable F420-dependent oxidoreductase
MSSAVIDKLATTGVWFFTDMLTTEQSRETAARIESLGYSALWVPDTLGRDPFVNAATLLDATDELIVATGIASIHMRHPGMMKQGAHSLAELSGGRFVLGLGVSHAPLVEGLRKLEYSKPLSTMRTYVEGLKGSMYKSVAPAEEPPMVLAALGPKMLELAATETHGAHPYWTTPEHTAAARRIMGPDAWLCVEQKCVLTTDADVARAKASEQLAFYIELPNYRNNWLRLGFTEDEISGHAPRFLDAVVAWGDLDAIKTRIQEHYDAGATHVCVQSVHPSEKFGTIDWDLLEALAPAA